MSYNGTSIGWIHGIIITFGDNGVEITHLCTVFPEVDSYLLLLSNLAMGLTVNKVSQKVYQSGNSGRFQANHQIRFRRCGHDS